MKYPLVLGALRSAFRTDSCRNNQTPSVLGRCSAASYSSGSEGQIRPITGDTACILSRSDASRLHPGIRLDQRPGFRAHGSVQFLDQPAHLRLRSTQGVAQIGRPGQCARVIQFMGYALQLSAKRLQASASIAGDAAQQARTNAVVNSAYLTGSSLIIEVGMRSKRARDRACDSPAALATSGNQRAAPRGMGIQHRGDRPHPEGRIAQTP
jgi:hypothetical protein